LQLLGQLNDDFHESQHGLSRHGRRFSMWRPSRSGIYTYRHSALFKTLKPFITLHSAHTLLHLCLIKHWNVSVKFLPSLQHIFSHTPVVFRLFHCHSGHLVTNPTNCLCTCSVQRV
jgi:hypothetical protein